MMSSVFAWQNQEQAGEDTLNMCCPRCENPLTFHQPDEELADRLLATCEGCKSWFLTDALASAFRPIADPPDELL
jgi:hypothetical protein